MRVRNSVRERRRLRIQQLIEIPRGPTVPEPPAGDAWDDGPARPETAGRAERPLPEPAAGPATPAHAGWAGRVSKAAEADPELWWKERQRQLAGGSDRSGIGLAGLSRLPGAGEPGGAGNGSGPGRTVPGSGVRGFMKELAVRTVAAGLLLAALWGWLRLELPGSGQARDWAIAAVTQDMDFQAIEAWYERTFDGSPSFLPIFRQQEETRAVSANWTREETVLPLEGRIVQGFDAGEAGIRLAAPEGSPVFAVHTGRVTQVTTGDEGLATILIQHVNRIVTVYGNVADPEVKPNDWVKAGQKLGELGGGRNGDGSVAGEGTLYFAVEQNGKTLDPAEVVPFD